MPKDSMTMRQGTAIRLVQYVKQDLAVFDREQAGAGFVSI
jgi:hypothetical protein